jgi:hypothetical protein
MVASFRILRILRDCFTKQVAVAVKLLRFPVSRLKLLNFFRWDLILGTYTKIFCANLSFMSVTETFFKFVVPCIINLLY